MEPGVIGKCRANGSRFPQPTKTPVDEESTFLCVRTASCAMKKEATQSLLQLSNRSCIQCSACQATLEQARA